MAFVIVRHGMADFDVWKETFDAHEGVRRQFGITGHIIGRDLDVRTPMTTVILRGESLPKLRAFINSMELRGAFEQAGVDAPSHIMFASELEEKSY